MTYFPVYVDNGRSTTETSLTFMVQVGASWRIKISQIECDSQRRAPEGCLQYLTGVSGSFQSLGFNEANPGAITRFADYTICVRNEAGFCAIDYSVMAMTTVGLRNAAGTMAKNVRSHLNKK